VDEGESAADAARREALEEIGLDPALPQLVGALPAVHTYVSSILVVPFVGLLELPPDLFAAEAEIKEIIRVPLAGLATVEEPMELPSEHGGVWRGWAYPTDGNTIWGATGLKKMLGADDSLDVFYVHGLGGIVGALAAAQRQGR
jgi:hypothetical protein